MKRKIAYIASFVLIAASIAAILFYLNRPKPEEPVRNEGFYGVWIARGDEYTIEITEDGLVKTNNTEFFDLYDLVPTLSFRYINETMGVFCVHYEQFTCEFACELDGEILVITPPVYFNDALVLKREGSSADLDSYFEKHFPHLVEK
ncbi:MAG: hypothetical protein J6L81_00455 [Clostridia bacterium]|nr:hypothetical protein [Clostridia bacterium]